jgi:hypothetical protein
VEGDVPSSVFGVGADAYTICIGHKEGDSLVVDVVRGTSGKFNPQAVTKEYAALCKDYRITKVTGDAYGAEWVASAWRGLGFEYIKSPQAKGALYLESLPAFTRGLARLPGDARLIRELRLLERRTHRSGKDVVEHPRYCRDDYANATCGVLSLLMAVPRVPEVPIVQPFSLDRTNLPAGARRCHRQLLLHLTTTIGSSRGKIL